MDVVGFQKLILRLRAFKLQRKTSKFLIVTKRDARRCAVWRASSTRVSLQVLAGTFSEAWTGGRAFFIALPPQKGQLLRLMKTTWLACFFFLTSMAEEGIHIPSIASMGADADTEAVVLGSVEPASRLMIDFTVTNPNSSNAVLLAFGKDLDADGELSTEEIKYQVGCDAGAWV